MRKRSSIDHISGNRNGNGDDRNLNPTSDSDTGISYTDEHNAIDFADLTDIDDGNLADADDGGDDDISYTKEEDPNLDLSCGPSLASLEYTNKKKHIPKGYIDDAVIDEVLSGSDARMWKKNSKFAKKIMIVVLIFFGALVIFLLNRDLKLHIEKGFRDQQAEFDFNDRDRYTQPVSQQVVDTGTEGLEPLYTLEAEIPLGISHQMPLEIEDKLTDFRKPITFDSPDIKVRLQTDTQTPFFWQIPFAGDVFQNFMTTCYKKVLASNHKLIDDDTMKIYMVDDEPYVNVDLSTDEGILSAERKGLVVSGIADVIVSSRVPLATSALFSERHQARLFTAIRHPVDRSVAEYWDVISLHHNNDTTIREMSLFDCLDTPLMNKEFMTRSLIGKPTGPLVRGDLDLAKEILRRDCLVGVYNRDITASMHLFEQYFGWTLRHGAPVRDYNNCRDEILTTEMDKASDARRAVGHIEMDERDPIYNKIVYYNKFDMELYWYAYDLHMEQVNWVEQNRDPLVYI